MTERIQVIAGAFWFCVKCNVCGKGCGRDGIMSEHGDFIKKHSESAKHFVYSIEVEQRQDNTN